MAGLISVSAATLEDAPVISEIYAYYVQQSTATFETVAPDEAVMIRRMERVLGGGYPWLVARNERGIATGYAYAARFHPREGYRYTCETSIYVRRDCQRQGIGTALIRALIVECEARGFRQAIAVIAGTEPASVILHARAGYLPCGTLESAGRKHGQWIDVLFMQRKLGAGKDQPPPVEP